MIFVLQGFEGGAKRPNTNFDWSNLLSIVHFFIHSTP